MEGYRERKSGVEVYEVEKTLMLVREPVQVHARTKRITLNNPISWC
jgi:hypothetical protein